VGQLDAPQPAQREHALAALQRNPAAVPLLVRRIKAEEDPDRLRTFARALEPHAADLKTAPRHALSKLLLGYLEADDRRAEPLAYLLRHVAATELDDALLRRAQRLTARARFAEANRILRVLVRGGSASADAIYQASVVALKVSTKRLDRHERHADACLDLLDRLLGDEAFGLAERLLAERALDLHDLFYVGFHFAEQLGRRREFGGALLQHVVACSPRSAVAGNARNKLRLEAFDLDAIRPPRSPARTAKRPTPGKAKKTVKKPPSTRKK
jgi:hypothetical protein